MRVGRSGRAAPPSVIGAMWNVRTVRRDVRTQESRHMAKRYNPTQAKSQLRRLQQQQRQVINKYNQAVNKYNSAVRQYNRAVKSAVTQYNQDVRAHNARVRANRQRLQRELRKLEQQSRSSSTRHVVYRRSVVALHQSYERIESAVDAGTWTSTTDLFDSAEGEAANSVAVLNVLLEETELTGVSVADLGETIVGEGLSIISPDLYARWQGALFALDPRNPDAARHFCTSAREILTSILEITAPDSEVLAADPKAPLTDDGRVTRRARIHHCLRRSGRLDEELVSFVEADIDNVIQLFREFNRGTHGEAGRFTLPQLAALKARVEHAIVFLQKIVAV